MLAKKSEVEKEFCHYYDLVDYIDPKKKKERKQRPASLAKLLERQQKDMDCMLEMMNRLKSQHDELMNAIHNIHELRI